MINFYDVIKKDSKRKNINPNYAKHGIKIPFRMIVASGSGTGKTNSICNLLSLFDKTFQKIILVMPTSNEPLYNHMKNVFQEKMEIYEEGNIPEMIDDDLQKLIIFDDMILYKDQKSIEEYYIRGRKMGYSCIYISQNFHSIPPIIRRNSQYFILGGNLLKKDLSLILSSFTSNLDKDEFIKIYRKCTDKPMNILLIDLNLKNIRHNIDIIVSEL